MLTNMFNKLSNGFSRTGSDRNSSARNGRTNRRYPISRGIEGLEGRLAPSGDLGTVGLTVTNTDPTTYQQDVITPPLLTVVNDDPGTY